MKSRRTLGPAAPSIKQAGAPASGLILVAFHARLHRAARGLRRVLATRARLGSQEAIAAFQARIKPFSIIGLIATVVILFGLQGQVIVSKPAVIALIAVPILLQSVGVFALAYGAAWALRVPHRIAAPCALIGTSNFFELAVAVAISLFGLNSGAALATVVGVLVEVPVMLSLVWLANRTRHLFPEAPADAVTRPIHLSSNTPG